MPEPVVFGLRMIRAFRRIKKYGDIEKIRELFKNAPPEVKERIDKMVDIVKEYNDGKIDRDQAINAISEIIGVPVDDLKELAETFLEFIEEELKE